MHARTHTLEILCWPTVLSTRPTLECGWETQTLLKKLIVPLPAAFPCKQPWLEMGWGLCIHFPFPCGDLVWFAPVQYLSFLSQSFWVCVYIHPVVSGRYFLGVIHCLGLLKVSLLLSQEPKPWTVGHSSLDWVLQSPPLRSFLWGSVQEGASPVIKAMHWSIGIVIDH